MQELHYALLDGELVSINEVKNGLKCGCVCPECGAMLVARKGNRRMHHFSHYLADECESGIETALHLLSKQVIEKTRRLFVPGIPSVEKSVGKVTEYDEAIEEKKIDGIIKADVQLRARMDLWGAGLVVNVEIKVSHAVDEAKKYKLLELGIPTIEIDLSELGADYNKETIEKIILSGEKTKWVYSPRAKRYFIEEWLCDKKMSKLRYGKHYWVDYCPLKKLETVYGRWWTELPCCSCVDAVKPIKEIKCMGKLNGIDISGIERIERVERERGFLKSVDLIVNGEKIHRDFDIPPKKENNIIYD